MGSFGAANAEEPQEFASIVGLDAALCAEAQVMNRCTATDFWAAP